MEVEAEATSSILKLSEWWANARLVRRANIAWIGMKIAFTSMLLIVVCLMIMIGWCNDLPGYILT